MNYLFQSCGPFFKLLTLLVEGSGGGAGATNGLPCFTQLVLGRLWDAGDVCPHAALEWLAMQVLYFPVLYPLAGTLYLIVIVLIWSLLNVFVARDFVNNH